MLVIYNKKTLFLYNLNIEYFDIYLKYQNILNNVRVTLYY